MNSYEFKTFREVGDVRVHRQVEIIVTSGCLM